jgi:hypothetical protein
MATSSDFVSPLRFLEENPAAVLAALRQGWVDYWDTAVDQVTDEHVRFALQSGLLAECAAAFPDPRLQPEIPLLVLLTASVAGAFQGEYGRRNSGCALHSPALLAELGLNAAWLAAGAGLSRRGTQDEAVFHGDVLRKLLQQVAAADQAAGRRPGESLLHWWNTAVGPAMQRLADGGIGVWIRDVTKILVNLNNPRYEQSEVATEEKPHGTKAPPQRGYKLGLLSCLLGTGRLVVQVAWDGLRRGERGPTAGRSRDAGRRRDQPPEAGSGRRCRRPAQEHHARPSHGALLRRAAPQELGAASAPGGAGDPEGARPAAVVVGLHRAAGRLRGPRVGRGEAGV